METIARSPNPAPALAPNPSSSGSGSGLGVRAGLEADGGAGGGDRTHTPLRVLDFESSASASSATPAFRAGQKLRRSSRACKPRGGPRTSRKIIAWRTLARVRSIVVNGWRGVTREGAVARGRSAGADGKVISG